MKKIIIVVVVVIAALVSGFLVFRPKTYSMLEIEADNYEQKLKASNEPLYYSAIDKCIPDKIDPLHSLNYTPSNNNGLEITKEKKDDFTSVRINSSISDLQYLTWFNKNNEPISCSISRNVMGYEPKLKEICNQLMLNGFILKKTKLLNGHDMLIKETDDNFIVININSKYEYPNPPMSLHIQTYGKEKPIF